MLFYGVNAGVVIVIAVAVVVADAATVVDIGVSLYAETSLR